MHSILILASCATIVACDGKPKTEAPSNSPFRPVFTEGTEAWMLHQVNDSNTVAAVGLRRVSPNTVAAAHMRTVCGQSWAKLSEPPMGVALAVHPARSIPSPPPPPRVSNIQTERAQWRIEELTGVEAGTTPSPAALRSIIKTRRDNAPPYFVLSGDNGCTGVVAIVNNTLRTVLAHETIELPGPECAPLVVHPPADLNGDGHPDWLVRAGREWDGHGLFRRVYQITLDDPPTFEAIWSQTLRGDCDVTNGPGSGA